MRNTCRTRLLAVGSPSLAFFSVRGLAQPKAMPDRMLGQRLTAGRLRREAMVMELALELEMAMRRDG